VNPFANPFSRRSAPLSSRSPREASATGHERPWRLEVGEVKETSYRLIVSGEFGPKEIGKLIKMLQAQKAILSDDEDEKEEAAN
jgi:hypothetical protein